MRFGVLKYMGVVVAFCAALAIWSGTPAGAASTGAQVWGAPVPLALTGAENAELGSVSCTGAGDCVAVGFYEVSAGNGSNNDYGLIAVESNGAWAAPVTVGPSALPSDVETTSGEIDINLGSVSCSSATSCEAVGSYESDDSNNNTESVVLPITLSGTVATPGNATLVTGLSETDNPALSSISCSSSGSCTAVGVDHTTAGDQLIVATSDGLWHNESEVPAAGHFPSGYASLVSVVDFGSGPVRVSCPPSGACVVVGNYDDASDNLYGFAMPLSDGTPGTAMLLPTPPNSASTPIVEGLGISCPAAGACTATGDYATNAGSDTSAAFAVPIANGTPGTPIELTSSYSDAAALPVSCTDASDCDLAGVATNSGASALLATDSETAGTWGALTPLAGFDPTNLATAPTDLSCIAAAACGLVGIEESPADTLAPFIVNSAPQLSVATSSLPGATVGAPYSATLQANGGIGASTWSLSSGSLPAGLSLNAATGAISGTPTAAGSDGFVVQVTNGGPPAQTATGGVSITVSAATPTSTTTPATPTPPVSTPVTTPPPTPKPAVAVVKITKVSDKGAKVSITLSCAKAVCKGTLGLSVVEHLSGTKVTSLTAIAKAKKTRTLTLAKGTYTLAAGKTRTLTLTLTKTAAKLLTARHRFTAKLALTPAGSKRATVTKTVTLKAAVVKQPRPKRPKRV